MGSISQSHFGLDEGYSLRKYDSPVPLNKHDLQKFIYSEI